MKEKNLAGKDFSFESYTVIQYGIALDLGKFCPGKFI